MYVFETNSSVRRLKNEFLKTYSYVLIHNKETLKVLDLDAPLRNAYFDFDYDSIPNGWDNILKSPDE
jgi:hypothetical protein